MIAVRATMIVVADALVTANVAIDTVVAEQRGLRGRYRRGKYVTKKEMHISKIELFSFMRMFDCLSGAEPWQTELDPALVGAV